MTSQVFDHFGVCALVLSLRESDRLLLDERADEEEGGRMEGLDEAGSQDNAGQVAWFETCISQVFDLIKLANIDTCRRKQPECFHLIEFLNREYCLEHQAVEHASLELVDKIPLLVRQQSALDLSFVIRTPVVINSPKE